MRKSKRLIVLATAFLSLQLLTGCQNQNQEQSKEVNQDEKQVVTDFYDMVNHQWLEENKDYSGFQYGAIQEQQNQVEEALDNYLKELSNQNSSQEESLTEIEEKAAILYEQATDMEKRNELGIKPIEKMLAEVEQVTDLNDLIALYKEPEMGFYNTLFTFQVEKNISDGSYQVNVSPETIYGQYGMLTDEQFAGYELLVKQFMMMAGYEESRAAVIAEHTVAMERSILELNYTQLNSFSRYGEKELSYLLSHLSIMEIAKEQGYLENRSTLTGATEHLNLMQELFVEDNVEVLKDYLLASVVIKSAPYLNEEMSEFYETAINTMMGANEKEEDSYAGCQIVSMAMEDFLAEYYMKEYVGEEMEQEVKSLTEEIRGELKEKIVKADWMCEQTKEYAVKKLDAMKLIVGLPEKMHDYSKLTIKSYEEGGNLMENILNAYILDCDFQKEFLKEECQDVFYFHALEVNAYYASPYNVFSINAAIITYDGCNKDSEYEEKLGILGFIIAHEISHGFDGTGSEFNAEGIYQNWWTTEDKMAYRERINEVKHYFDGMEVVEQVTLVGEQCMDEAYADLSAMSVCMDLLGKRAGSDYTLFFETYGKSKRIVTTDEYFAYMVSSDTHLPNKLRVNQIVNQMDEFYEVYQIPEENEMYVPVEERLRVWE